ncbi:MotA/TolQ/ExbB proton channel family protein [Prochlorococcus marinus]|uniref:MotA/TolQ/ExbB proton channel family protein n=1 Tax=Prochlorococcus marinus TaxID=1219 RepID=UPI0022B50BF7|nr:MotA/TolQ/ExbB proton channel family protein [Prochlorococcus marinus]
MFDIFKSGGIVMWPLLLISITSLACIFERIAYWKDVIKKNDSKLMITVEKYSTISSVDITKQNEISSIPLEKVLLDSLKIIDRSLLTDKNSIDLKLALEISIQSIQSEFGKFSNLFSTIITVSPLLGLLGTVLGLINSFSFIKLGESGVNAQEVTGGISEALISTATGLIIAIITLIFSNYFNSLWRKQNSILNQYCGRFEMLYRTNKL